MRKKRVLVRREDGQPVDTPIVEPTVVESPAAPRTRAEMLGENELSIREDEAKRHAALAAAQAKMLEKNRRLLQS